MKIVNINDLHLTPGRESDGTIGKRTDRIFDTQLDKLDQLFYYVETNKVDLVLIGGDVYDTAADHPSWFLNKVFNYFKELRSICPIEIIPGNHDLIGHSLDKLDDSTVGLLRYLDIEVSETISWLQFENTAITLVPFGMTPPPPTKRSGTKDILLLHEPVYEKDPPFYMQDAVSAEALVDKYPGYDLYLAGDIHERTWTDKVLVTGSMTRLKTPQKDFEPGFFVIDTDTMKVGLVKFEIKKDIWLAEEIKEKAPDSEIVKGLSEAMKEQGELPDYEQVVIATNKHKEKFQSIFTQYRGQL